MLVNPQGKEQAVSARPAALPTGRLVGPAHSEGPVRFMLDGICHCNEPLPCARLCQGHAWLFPEPDELLSCIRVGALRGETPMLVVSGRLDRLAKSLSRANEPDSAVAGLAAAFNKAMHEGNMPRIVLAVGTGRRRPELV
ncbi:filamentation induced by cAMP protein fic [Alcanivorax sp. S71-1-4]|nr:filamentation induced by cAMP protein fic [Alcanivorax sp. S71-1-4]